VAANLDQVQDRFVYSTDDVLAMLDDLVEGSAPGQWDDFFADRARPCPFFVDSPDENLAGWFSEGLLTAGRALELGCGNGRNASYLAGQGCTVQAIDFSARAVEWARQRTQAAGATVTFQCCTIFEAALDSEYFDLVYDSGCFHHLAPHRRRDYVSLVHRVLKPGGSFGLVCFRPEGGSGYTDQQVYSRASLGGGLGYSADRLRAVWDKRPFSVRVLRQMSKNSQQDPYFGEDFLWALLATKAPAQPR
jgi:SAM-dependent methyltransferase